jgi:sterol desaturase/sphingolipid hydroxylase (fatty acid hydroxylase superfamily)
MVELLLTTIGSLALLALAFVPLERMFPARVGQRALRPGLPVDLLFFAGQYLLFSGLALSLLLGAKGLLAAAVPGAFRAWVAAWPWWAQIAAAVALGDLAVYWFHRACHAFEPLWHFHAVHHSAEHLDFLAAHREHPLDGILTQLCVNLPAFAMGFPLHHIAGFLALRGVWAVFIHANVRLPLGPLRWVLGAPERHHWHHARVERTRHNFSNLAPWVDVLFGTYHRPEGPETYPLGLTGAWPKGYLAQLLHPFAALARRSAARPGGAADGCSASADGCAASADGCAASADG